MSRPDSTRGLVRLEVAKGQADPPLSRYIEAYKATVLVEEDVMGPPELRVCLRSLGYDPTEAELPALVSAAQWEHILPFVDCTGFCIMMEEIVSGQVPCTLAKV